MFLKILNHESDFVISLLKMPPWFPYTEKACHDLLKLWSVPCAQSHAGSPCLWLHQALATAAFLLFLVDNQLIHASGPLHLLFYCLGFSFLSTTPPPPFQRKNVHIRVSAQMSHQSKSPTLPTPFIVLFQPTSSHSLPYFTSSCVLLTV